MIVTLMLGIVLQAAASPPTTGKERHRTDRSALADCDVKATAVVATMKDLPEGVRHELARFSTSLHGMADVGGRFNATDVIEDAVPRSRFLRAYRFRERWVVWYELGGFARMTKVVMLRPVPALRGETPGYRAEPGTILGGNLCAATRAVLGGVTS